MNIKPELKREWFKGSKYRVKPPTKKELGNPNYHKPTIPLKNNKIADNIGKMHMKWLSEQFPSRVNKPEPDLSSNTSKKLGRS